jgi:hypothetical protein
MTALIFTAALPAAFLIGLFLGAAKSKPKRGRSKGIDGLMADYKKLQGEDQALHEEIKKLSDALDSHTDEKRSANLSATAAHPSSKPSKRLARASNRDKGRSPACIKASRQAWSWPSTRRHGSGRRQTPKIKRPPYEGGRLIQCRRYLPNNSLQIKMIVKISAACVT